MSDTQENWAEEAPAAEEEFPIEEMAIEESENEPKMFGKWDLTEVKCMDMALADYIKFDKSNGRYLAHNSTRVNKTRFKKAQMHIVERLVNALMQKGRNNGKKLLSMRIVKHTFEIIHVMTGENPVQICVSAIMNGGPREDSTRIGRAGSVQKILELFLLIRIHWLCDLIALTIPPYRVSNPKSDYFFQFLTFPKFSAHDDKPATSLQCDGSTKLSG